ncbi:GNAT family N-acetyltransferase [Rubrivirga sp.]|uniref:GNAT family N-acetyltransferase n=1 Tax=Rubrivirga sp. TaxID=1885344 RepID=UPI003C70BF89
MTIPTFQTERLTLRPVEAGDASAIGAVARLREIADTMISIPHPYPDGEAERFVAARRADLEGGRGSTFVAETHDGAFCGLAEIWDTDLEHEQAGLSFWLAPDAWGRGYMSEIVRVIIEVGFGHLGMNRLYAPHVTRNPASGRVLEKNGFSLEVVLRQRVRKWGRFEDVALWSRLASDPAP